MPTLCPPEADLQHFVKKNFATKTQRHEDEKKLKNPMFYFVS
jgi:hypothetical protein